MKMNAGKARPKDIDEYIDVAPKATQKKLLEMRACIRKAAPGAKEGLKWGMPAFSYKRILVVFAAHKGHIGFYPTPSAVKAFAKDLSKFATASGSRSIRRRNSARAEHSSASTAGFATASPSTAPRALRPRPGAIISTSRITVRGRIAP